MQNKPLTILALPAAFALSACATTAGAPLPDGSDVALGQKAYVDGPLVQPVEVVEDSRCPMNARCVWAGRTRLSVRIELGSRSETREIGSDQPIQVADGQLSLVEVRPDTMAGQPVDPAAYRFGFTFAGGL